MMKEVKQQTSRQVAIERARSVAPKDWSPELDTEVSNEGVDLSLIAPLEPLVVLNVSVRAWPPEIIEAELLMFETAIRNSDYIEYEGRDIIAKDRKSKLPEASTRLRNS